MELHGEGDQIKTEEGMTGNSSVWIAFSRGRGSAGILVHLYQLQRGDKEHFYLQLPVSLSAQSVRSPSLFSCIAWPCASHMRHVRVKNKRGSRWRQREWRGELTTLGEDIGGMWGRNVINHAMNEIFIHLPTSPADIISAIGVNMGLDEGAGKYPAGKKKFCESM